AAATVAQVRALLQAGVTQDVTLVAMGLAGAEPCVEDRLCADLLEARLQGRSFALEQIEPRLRATPAGALFADPRYEWAPAADFDLCIAVDRCAIAAQLQRAGDGLWSLVPANGAAAFIAM
ncbi:MAG: hypothetical protein NZM12_03360, partial [Steroidobacteraceae bacterium]|nr:hypothetical protein [Steroidobacteraceae bacterium]